MMSELFLYLIILYYLYLLVLLSINARARHLQERNRHREALDLRRRTQWLNPPRSQMRILGHLQASVAAHHAALPQEALEESRAAFTVSRTETHRAIALAVQSMSLRALGEMELAYQKAQEAVKRSESIKNVAVKAECLLVLAEREREAGRFAHALAHANDMLELPGATPSMLGMAHLMRGSIFRSMGCDMDAEDQFELALGQAYAPGYWADRAKAAAHLALATLAARRGQGEAGLEHLKKIGDAFENDARVEVLQASLGVWLRAASTPHSNVLADSKEALAKLDRISADVQYVAVCRACVGMGLLKSGNAGEALHQFGLALQAGLGEADTSRLLLDMSDAYRQLNRNREADDLLRRIVALGIDGETTREAQAQLDTRARHTISQTVVVETTEAAPQTLTLSTQG